MSQELVITIAQINPTVGDIEGNKILILDACTSAQHYGSDLIIFPETAITGYPAEDLLLRPSFVHAAMDALKNIITWSANNNIAILVGGVYQEGQGVHNSAFFIEQGRLTHTYHKYCLPNYGVFDEKRVFVQGRVPRVFDFKGLKVAIVICEDLWSENLISLLARQQPDIIFSLNASPFEISKRENRQVVAEHCVLHTQASIIYVNQLGGQDELVFDGGSFIINAKKKRNIIQFPHWKNELFHSYWRISKTDCHCITTAQETLLETSQDASTHHLYNALVLGVRDYVIKNKFPGVLLGLSGGIDSALVASIASDALGPEHVFTFLLPSRYTSKQSTDDAVACAALLGVSLEEISIEIPFENFTKELEVYCKNHSQPLRSITEENLQSRIRGLLLMALSNQTDNLLLTTGNKSEMAVGYATLYGDMNGGFNPLKDIYKTEVYTLAKWRNQHIPSLSKNQKQSVIPESIITRPPSAELRHNQCDQDSLPDYEVLDHILEALIEQRESIDAIARNSGFDLDLVKKVARLLVKAEFKRRQSPPGVKVTKVAFGRDYRYPITQHTGF